VDIGNRRQEEMGRKNRDAVRITLPRRRGWGVRRRGILRQGALRIDVLLTVRG
jgi:hypothetical protein